MGETLAGCFPQQCPQRAWQGVCSDAQGTGPVHSPVPWTHGVLTLAPAASQLRLLLGQPEESPQHLSCQFFVLMRALEELGRAGDVGTMLSEPTDADLFIVTSTRSVKSPFQVEMNIPPLLFPKACFLGIVGVEFR